MHENIDKIKQIIKDSNELEVAEDQGIILLISTSGKLYPCVQGTAHMLQGMIEGLYNNSEDFKEIINDVASGESVLDIPEMK